jgi:hypothetical protein
MESLIKSYQWALNSAPHTKKLNDYTIHRSSFKFYTNLGGWLVDTSFYLPHMEFEGSIGFVMRKMKKNYC